MRSAARVAPISGERVSLLIERVPKAGGLARVDPWSRPISGSFLQAPRGFSCLCHVAPCCCAARVVFSSGKLAACIQRVPWECGNPIPWEYNLSYDIIPGASEEPLAASSLPQLVERSCASWDSAHSWVFSHAPNTNRWHPSPGNGWG